MSKGKTLGTKCPACNASIKFNPKSNKWKCEYCGSEFSLEEMEKVTSGSASKENNKKNKEQKEDINYLVYHCQSCGAEIVADEETAATFCVYCGSTTILQNKLEGEFSPDFVIPFKTEKKDAEDAFAGLSKGRIFTPKDFTDKTNIEKIRGIYIPFWLFDYFIDEDAVINATKVRTWVVGDTHYTETQTYEVLRQVNMKFHKIPIDASTRFDNDIMDTIQPYNYEELVDYNHAYLSGFYAERFDQKEEELADTVRQRVMATSRKEIMNSLRGYSTTRFKDDTCNLTRQDIKYALLPVWMVNVKYKDKMYLFAMNGQTKEFIGNIPVDYKKAILLTLLVLGVTFIIAFVIAFIFTGGLA